MSKERLEIIKKLRETILEENDFRTRCVLAYVFVNLGYMDWLIEQAERAQELEGEIKKIRDAYNERLVDIKWYQNMLGIDYEEMSIELPIERVQGEKIKRLEKQNKRYREALEKITNDEYIQDYCEEIGCYEYEAMRDIAYIELREWEKNEMR